MSSRSVPVLKTTAYLASNYYLKEDCPIMPTPDPARVLTFHPSRDDPAALKAFLSSTFQRYKEQTQTVGILLAHGINTTSPPKRIHPLVEHQGQQPGSAGVPRPSCLPVARDTSKKRKASSLVPRNSFKYHADTTYPAFPAPVMPGTRSPDTTQYPVKTTKKAKKQTVGPVKLSTATRCSLLRAKQAIDTRAPDPELEAPPDETEVQKRRRLERINGRRKRTKKLIEIDQLHEQVGALTNRNQNVKRDNDALRQARDALRRALLLRDRKVAGATENIKTAVAVASKALQRFANKPTASEEEEDKGESHCMMAASVPNKYHQKSFMHQKREKSQRLVPQLLQRQQRQHQELRMPASSLRAACSLRILPPPPQQPPSNSYHDLLRSSLTLQQQQRLASLSTTSRNIMFLNQTQHQPKTGDIDGRPSPALLRRRPAAAPGGGPIESLLLQQHRSDMQGQLALLAAMVRFAPPRHDLSNDHNPHSEEDHKQA